MYVLLTLRLHLTMGNRNSIPSFYANSPLSSHKTRLLSIFPSLKPEQQLACYISAYELNSAPPYEALS
jgi:hypothetical protein